MASPEVSIIVPVYNSATTIDRCVKSILHQTIDNWELLLVDNGSSDKSYELISVLAKRDNRIHALQESQPGVAYARNKALDTAKGKYICFVDSDDEIERDYLEQLLSEPQTDITVCGYFVDTENSEGERINTENFASETVLWTKDKSKSLLIPAFEMGFMHLCCNKLFRREIIEIYHIRFEHYPVNEDYVFALSFLQYAESVLIIDKPLYHWIRVEGKATGVKSIPVNLLNIYNTSHRQCRTFFKDNAIADKIAYYSYEMIVYKYYEAIRTGRIPKREVFNKLDEFVNNALVIAAYKSYRPKSPGETLLYWFLKMRLYKIHYFITQKVL